MPMVSDGLNQAVRDEFVKASSSLDAIFPAVPSLPEDDYSHDVHMEQQPPISGTEAEYPWHEYRQEMVIYPENHYQGSDEPPYFLLDL